MDTVITIGREFGSGGHEIGRHLAECLSIPCYDKELMVLAAQRAGISADVLGGIDETATNSFLYAVTTGTVLPGAFQTSGTLPLNDRLFNAQAELIREKAEEGPCVFVGRCADFILRDRNPLLRVFIRADLEFRVQRIMEGENCSRREAEDLIAKSDRKRAKFYSFYSQKRWGDASSYDMVLNNAKLGTEQSVSLIVQFAEQLSR